MTIYDDHFLTATTSSLSPEQKGLTELRLVVIKILADACKNEDF